MRIDGVGNQPPIPPGSIGGGRAAAAGNSTSIASLVNQTLIQQEQKGGGGGHGGGHGVKKANGLEAIDDIASRASLNIEGRDRTVLDRMREIAKLQEAAEAASQQVGEKKDGEGKRNPEHESGDDDDAPDDTEGEAASA